jgi:protein SCO1/2
VVALACGGIVGITLAIGAAGNSDGEFLREATEAAATAAAGLSFTDHQGRAVSEDTLKGEFLLVFFGYTHCPDVCPTALQVMSSAVRRLGTAGDRIRPVFISLDPARDTPEVLRDYVGHFHPRLLGLTGTEEQIHAAARAYDLLFVRGAVDAAGGYSISHEDDLYLIGPEGEAIAILDGHAGVDALVSELAVQLSSYGGAQARGGDS